MSRQVFDTFTLAELMRLDDIDLDQLDEIRDPQAIADWWTAKRAMWAEQEGRADGREG